MIVLYFEGNASVSGAGLAIPTQYLLDAAKRGKRVVVARLPKHFKKVVRIVGITKLAEIEEPQEDAKAKEGV